MSEPENFLSRWSRRKLETEQERGENDVPDRELEAKLPIAGGKTPGETEKPDDRPDQDTPRDEPAFDLTKLPSLESITAETDIRVFLQKGVPGELSRAALRRAWSADPAIRDFIGIAENQYDFATGKDLPGFGELDIGADELRRLVAEVFGEKPAPLELPTPPSPAVQAAAPMEHSPVADLQKPVSDTAGSEEKGSQGADSIASDEASPHRSKVDIAAHQSISEPDPDPLPARRPHGRALPQ